MVLSLSTSPHTELPGQPASEALLQPPVPIQNRKTEDTRGWHLGGKMAKAVKIKQRHKEIALRNGADIATAMKRNTEFLEEHNALQAFFMNECLLEEDKKDRESTCI